MNVSEAKQFFAKVNELDNLPPAGANEQLVREASAALFAAGIADAMDQFTAWQAKDAAHAATKPATADKADWTEVNVASLPDAVQKLYAAKRTADKASQTAREAFEKATIAAVKPRAGKVLRFGYRFGKLSVAWVNEDDAAKRTSTGAVSLSDL
jgi:hypothetical protein